MFPATAHFCIMPFYDEQIYNEQMQKTVFWEGKSFYGVDLSVLKEKAI